MKATMKIFMARLIILSLVCTSCTGEDGMDGIDGIDGIDGNANIIVSEWIETDFSPTPRADSRFRIEDPLIVLDHINSAAIHVYGLWTNSDAISPFPNANFQLNERYNFIASPGGITIIGHSLDGATEIYERFDHIRYVIIPSNTNTTRSSSSSTAIDYTDYNAVKEAYNLKD